MTTTSVLAALLLYFHTIDALGIYCYQCNPLLENPGSIEPKPICSNFNRREPEFEVYCPKSTMCMKRITRLKVRNKTLEIVQRGCALQKRSISTYNNAESRWQSEEEVEEDVYDDGCFPSEDIGSPSNPPEFCYCRFNLCNGKSNLLSSIDLYGSILLSIFVIEFICVQNIISSFV